MFYVKTFLWKFVTPKVIADTIAEGSEEELAAKKAKKQNRSNFLDDS